jgi:hypothetical protein
MTMDNYPTSTVRTALAWLVLLAADAFAVAGCATTGDVIQRAPAVQFASTKPPAQVSSCIAPAILHDWGQSKIAPSDNGTMIVVSGSAWGNPVAIIEVRPASTGSHLTIRRGGVSDHVFDGIVHVAQVCR